MPGRVTQKAYDNKGLDLPIVNQIAQCLHLGCVIRIEHASAMVPEFTQWKDFCQPCLSDGDVQKVIDAIDNCRIAHGDHYVRLVLEDLSCRSRFAFVVHDPVAAPDQVAA